MKLITKILITFIVFGLFTVGFYFLQYRLYSESDWDMSSIDTIYFISNGLSVSGLLCLASSGLYYTASEGAFDGMAYATHQVFSTLFRGRKYPYSFSEYKIKLHTEKRISLWHLIIVGVFYLVAGGLLYLYYQNNV